MNKKGARNVDIVDRTTGHLHAGRRPGGTKAVEALLAGLTEADASQLAYYHAAPTRCLGQQSVVSRTGYTGEDGLELIIGADHGVALCDELVRRGVVPCGLGARDTLRLEAAMPLFGPELGEDIDPLQAGLALRSVKFDKGDFIGREALVASPRGQVAARACRSRAGRKAHSSRGAASCTTTVRSDG